jgi:hypothetical protein
MMLEILEQKGPYGEPSCTTKGEYQGELCIGPHCLRLT